jgi:hypothetical protein
MSQLAQTSDGSTWSDDLNRLNVLNLLKPFPC